MNKFDSNVCNNLFFILLSCLILSGCQAETTGKKAETTPETENTTTETTTHNTLSEAERSEGWRLLFDGKTTNGWRVYQEDSIRGWSVESGELIALGEAGREGHANDIISVDTFRNFELNLEWKVSPVANSGIFFNVIEDPSLEAVYESGPEYQIIDDYGWPEKLEEWQKSGANYAMHPPSKINSKPVGEFNTSRVIVNDGHVEHWLNGEKVVEYDLWTPEWEKAVRDGKWKDSPFYGKAKSGHIALQDHGNKIWFRNIKIKEL